MSLPKIIATNTLCDDNYWEESETIILEINVFS